MKKQIRKISIVSSISWAAAIIAAAIIKAPAFYTIILLPMLAFSTLASIQSIGRQSAPNATV